MSLKIKALREKRAESMDKADRLVKLSRKENRNFTIQESRRFDELMDEVESIDTTLGAAERVKDSLLGKSQRSTKKQENLFLASMARSLYRGEKRDGINSTNGSATIQDPIVMDKVIQQLIPNNKLVDLGAKIQNYDNYSLWPKVTNNPSTQWFNEGDTISSDTAMTIGSEKVEFKTLTCFGKFSNHWLEDSGERGLSLANGAMVNAINEAMFKAVLSGSTANKQPNGFDNITGVQTVDAASATLSASNDYDLFIDAMAKLAEKNVDLSKVGYIYGVDTFKQMQKLKDADTNPLTMPSAMANAKSFLTSAVLEDYGAGTDETRIYLGDFSQLIIALGGNFRMVLDQTYATSLETAFLIYMRVDVKALRPDNFCIIQNLATA